MRKYKSAILFLLFSTAIIFAADGKKYGEELTLNQKTNVSEIMLKPDEYVGKKVLIEGLIVDVCAKRGCWMEIASDKEYESIRVKVDDGVIVFPMEAKGETAVVEGEVYSFNLEEQSQCSNKAKEACSDDKMKKDTAGKSCCPKDKKVTTVYQIKATGAVI